jgi:hypothetical protein
LRLTLPAALFIGPIVILSLLFVMQLLYLLGEHAPNLRELEEGGLCSYIRRPLRSAQAVNRV